MAGTKRPAEAVGFLNLNFEFDSNILTLLKKESVEERSAAGEALTKVIVDEAEVRMSA
jgi:hypothetical protein